MTEQEFAAQYEVGFENLQTEGIVPIMVRLFAVITTAIDRIRKARSTATVGVKKAVEVISQNAETVSEASDIGDEIRTLLFGRVMANHDLSVLLPDILRDVIDEVTNVRSLVIKGMDIDDDDEETDTTEDCETASLAMKVLRNYSSIMGMQNASLSDLPATMVKKNKKGELMLNLPHDPAKKNSDSASEGSVASSGAGRPVSGGKFKFHLNGVHIPVSGFDRLATFHCSTPTNWISGDDLKGIIKKQTGKEWSDKGNEKFTVTVPAGTLVAELVTQ
jgi:hypothetical protein